VRRTRFRLFISSIGACVGHFGVGKIAAWMAYVDLKPIRACIAETSETNDFPSVKLQIEDRTAAKAECSVASVQCSAGTSLRTNDVSPGEMGNSRSNQIYSANRNRCDDRVEHGDKAGLIRFPLSRLGQRVTVHEIKMLMGQIG